ncbi:hypothetical protein L227DRAFT_223537 [Lentinus tigrinus ALCF2SS1-6]|uniref:Uncharacterized protein n=1 Tax=Lentinus tigrinus ALCF2SS1-6 TaxID=1328759 RepID=A0A5C2S8X1_9APHY|nr:hypothetical protein L227DRAFT_223537 [Lentinus tigrinus ALCF2SS1-6]
MPSPGSMARMISAMKPSMFPLPSSPVGRLQPADFSFNSRFAVGSPSTDSMSGSSEYRSPARGRLGFPVLPGRFLRWSVQSAATPLAAPESRGGRGRLRGRLHDRVLCVCNGELHPALGVQPGPRRPV